MTESQIQEEEINVISCNSNETPSEYGNIEGEL